MLDVEGEEGALAREGADRRSDARSGRPIAWSPDGKWLAFFTAGTRGFTNVAIVPAAGGEARPVSFLANANATGVAWSPDGTFLLFDTGQRTEVPQLARVDLILRTPKFREDQFRDLFNEDQQPRRPATPTAPPADEASPKPETATARREADACRRRSRDTDIVFDEHPPAPLADSDRARRRRSLHQPGRQDRGHDCRRRRADRTSTRGRSTRPRASARSRSS